MALAVPSRLQAQESPYLVTYDHYLEEPGNLEVEYFSTLGTQRAGHDFHAGWLEFEYGATAWWTTELYLDGQTTFHDSTIFTGFRWENRFRLLPREHWINPVFYVEFENINGANKSLLEIVNHDGRDDLAVPRRTRPIYRQDRPAAHGDRRTAGKGDGRLRHHGSRHSRVVLIAHFRCAHGHGVRKHSSWHQDLG